MADDLIIKKVKKVSGHGHHGGAWKVAYADFVTAMMAFFLLMWLLNAVSEESLSGIADYFSPTEGLKGEMGIGFKGGKGQKEKGISPNDFSSRGIVYGAPEAGPMAKIDGEKEGFKEDTEEGAIFSMVEQDVSNAISESEDLKEFEDNILIDYVPDGLRIQITDSEEIGMFEKDSDTLLPHTKKILKRITDIIKRIPNYMSITGHTGDSFATETHQYSKWELSVDRANSARRFMIESGINKAKIAKIIGKADADPLDWNVLSAPKNQRISIILLKNAVLPQHKQNAPDEVMNNAADVELEEYLEILPDE